jgi:hypothetical protein
MSSSSFHIINLFLWTPGLILGDEQGSVAQHGKGGNASVAALWKVARPPQE